MPTQPVRVGLRLIHHRSVRQVRHIGHTVSTVVSLLNPADLIIGGDLANSSGHLVSVIQECVYGESGSLATTALQISACKDTDHAGIAGAVAMCLDRALEPASIEHRLAA